MCPDCLVRLVDDLDARVTCRHCGRDWPATMVSCPNCLAELRPDPDAALEAMGRILSMGGHLPRAAGVAAFANGPGCTLQRLAARGPMVYTGVDGLIEASVSGSEGRAVPPLACDDAGDVLFRLLAYEPAEAAVVAVGADGAALATFLRHGDDIDVRDETSAPVARLVGRRGGYDVVETGGGTLAEVGRTEHEIDDWTDDQWWLQPLAGARALPMRPFAAVALVLAAKVLLGRPWPVRAGEQPAGDDDDDYQPWPFS
ncbi:MAG: hypothetical protein ACR2HM_07615 [Acidimicrobiales bacterium]